MSNFNTLPAAALVDGDDAAPQGARLADAWWTLRHNFTSMIGLVLLTIILLAALLAPLIAPYDPYELDLARATLPPNSSHWFGTDQFGHDIFSRVLYGARLDLLIALASVAVSAVIGSVIGGVSGYVGRFVDEATMRLMDMLQAFPRFIFAMGIAFALGPGLLTVIVATAALNIPGYARLMRNLILSLKQTQYAMSAVAIGNSGPRVLFRHLFPNALAPILVTSTLQSGWAILEAAGLSFIGLGVAVPTAEWGVMIAMGLQEFLQGHWWVYTFPGLAIGVTVLAFNLIGDGLQDLLDPRRTP
ncbi:MAG: ABC transporter permease [Chloroflexi bacterium]|nr:ABC transporter permease [Chloroflexota bacterium]